MGRNVSDFESRDEYVTMSRQEGEAIQTYQYSVQPDGETSNANDESNQQQQQYDAADEM